MAMAPLGCPGLRLLKSSTSQHMSDDSLPCLAPLGAAKIAECVSESVSALI